ncbi:hypothetical protein JOM56_000329 [Amanita muscaria]
MNTGSAVISRDPALVPALEAFISLKNSHITADSRSALQYISLRSIDMSSPDLLNATIQRLLALESITHIRIRGGNMPLNIFKHFPSRVKILELGPMTFRNSATATAQVADGYSKLVNLPAIRLESLVIWGPSNPDHNSSEVIFNNPNRGCDGTSIRTLHLGYLYTHELGMYGTFAPHVEKLTVELKDEQTYTPIDFSQFSRLQYFYISRIGIDRQIRWLARSLRHVKTDNSFRSITLNYVNDQSLNMLAWAELDSVLAGSQFESESFSGMTIEDNYSRTGYCHSLRPRTIDKKLLKVVREVQYSIHLLCDSLGHFLPFVRPKLYFKLYSSVPDLLSVIPRFRAWFNIQAADKVSETVDELGELWGAPIFGKGCNALLSLVRLRDGAQP